MKKDNKNMSRFSYALHQGGIRELANEYSGEIFVTITAVVTIAGLYFWFFIYPSLNIGGSSLYETSKNVECGNDIQDALGTFRKNMDMPYTIEPEDYKIIFNNGQIIKEYDRDGIHYRAFFNILNTSEGCFLKFFKKGKSQPGHHEITMGNYGIVKLSKCNCE
ncbi:hypothetical protein F9K33_15615 [bacterium]|nr:MAG: hypothetical protein F9K33_15615 [bacterium]